YETEPEVKHAKTFWAEEDVDQVFSGIFEYLDHLKRVLQKKTATDKGAAPSWLVLAERLCIFCCDVCVSIRVCSGGEAAGVSGLPLLGRLFLQVGCCRLTSPSPAQPPLPLPPPPPHTSLSAPHQACLPRMPQSSSPLCGQNPLKVPLLCGFKRLTEDVGNWDVIYKAPCGQSLCNYDDVMCFLSVTESYDILQVDFFTFSHLVQLDPPMASGQPCLEEDLSRGAEPMPVELCVGDGGARPSDFRYRKDRWPHGCFLSRGPKLFHVCCDCSDGCCDAEHCACVAMTIGGRGYSHHRLLELYECGPWCGCDRSRCQNRLVQRGIRVRLQVFQTGDRGWGVRCRDDLDRGTFVCIFAGVVLQRVQSPVELQSPKLFAADLPSDDEVEVVTEWLAPPVLEGRRSLVEMPPPVLIPASLRLNVPVIQRPAGPAGSSAALKRGAEVEDVCLVDASKEGNVSRFINHSCQPNLFIQNVFTDSHDPAFPVIAFFTDR
uniref:Histone-lysine N-methyltransferase SETDB2 n=1 Tax=Kryptolebias marmoratus TaxID=37003 RepID=A0A3Q3AIW9_KRYMA